MMMRIQPYLPISAKFRKKISVRTVCTAKFNNFRKEKNDENYKNVNNFGSDGLHS